MEIRPRRGIHERNKNRNVEQFIAREQENHMNGHRGDDDYNSEDEQQITFNSEQLLIEQENRYNHHRLRKSYPKSTDDNEDFYIDDPGDDDNDDHNNITVVWDNNSSQSFQSSKHSSPNSSHHQKKVKTPPSSPKTNSMKKNKSTLENNNIKLLPESNSARIYFIILFVLLFLCCIFLGLIFNQNQNTKSVTADVQCDFDDLKQQFPRQNEFFWRSLQNGIEGVFKQIYPMKLSVFLLAYNKQSKSTAKLLIDKIVDRTIKCKHNSDGAVRLDQFDFQTPDVEADYGVVLTKYKELLFQRRIMVVKDFNKVPYKAARAFHTICDTETPWVRTSVIYLTMEIETNNTKGDHSRTIMEQIESHLETNWRDLNENTLAPIIARVTDQILLIES